MCPAGMVLKQSMLVGLCSVDTEEDVLGHSDSDGSSAALTRNGVLGSDSCDERSGDDGKNSG